MTSQKFTVSPQRLPFNKTRFAEITSANLLLIILNFKNIADDKPSVAPEVVDFFKSNRAFVVRVHVIRLESFFAFIEAESNRMKSAAEKVNRVLGAFVVPEGNNSA